MKKIVAKLNLTHNKFKTLLLHVPKHGDVSILFRRRNQRQLHTQELNPQSVHSLGGCQPSNVVSHNQFGGGGGGMGFFGLIFLDKCLKSPLWFAFVVPNIGRVGEQPDNKTV